ncbi:MAG: pentapeptide repeat-containing protein [Desulfomonilia bacterium]|jgi:uncharacterized protein YjbI with pentapeptide repeats
MPILEHIDILRKGVDVWNQWRKDNPTIIPDLSGADLTTNIVCNAEREELINYLIGGSRFYKHGMEELSKDVNKLFSKPRLYIKIHLLFIHIADWRLRFFRRIKGKLFPFLTEKEPSVIKYSSYLRGINLSHCNLNNANLEAVYMPEANLEKAKCEKANFNNTDLRYSNFSNASLYQACFTNSDLENAQLIRSNLSEANFHRAILRGSILNDIIAYGVDFSGADLGYSNCHPIDFQKIDPYTFRSQITRMNHAYVNGANFNYTNMRDIEMNRASLNGAKFVKADLSNAQLSGSFLAKTDLSGAILEGANLEKTNVFDVKFNRLGKFRGIRLDRCYGSARFERFAKDQNYLEELRNEGHIGRISYNIWLILADCGRTPWRWIMWSTLAILFFGSLYANYELPTWLAWIPDYGKKVIADMCPHLKYVNRTPFTPYYFSIVTFTTLGFGDVVPINMAGEICVSLEVIIGYVMLGGLISILASIIARRS